MQCTKVRDLLPDYSVQLLDARTQQEVAGHLALCADCSHELKLLDDVMLLVADQGALEPPPGLFNGVRNRIESGQVRRESPPWWAFLWSRPARAAAMAMSMAAVVLGLLLPAPRPNEPSLELHANIGPVSGELASSIRQHALSAGEGPLADRVAWEALAQLALDDRRSDTDDNGGSEGVN